MAQELRNPKTMEKCYPSLEEKHKSEVEGDPPPKTNEKEETSSNLHYTIHVYEGFKIQIYKPLIRLKICLFLLFGAGSFIMPFVTVLYKLRGVTLSELSMMLTLGPILQVLVSFLSGIAADKLGRAKPVFVLYILVSMLIVISLIFMPSMVPASCTSRDISVECSTKNIVSNSSCNFQNTTLYLHSCYSERDLIAKPPTACPGMKSSVQNYSMALEVNRTYSKNGLCYLLIDTTDQNDDSLKWCDKESLNPCSVSCKFDDCPKENHSHGVLLTVYGVLYVLFITVYTNVYRMMDVTAMSLIKEHNGNFGHERVFSILGNVIMSPICGLLVKLTTPEDGPSSYTAALWLNVSLYALLLFFSYNLKVTARAPGQEMTRKTFTMLKKPDVIVFIVILIVLGTNWNFAKIYTFWYLEGLGAGSVLIGLVPSVGALYGLPFLWTSKFWVRKMGPKTIFLLAHVGYALCFVAYSFIENTWISLILEATDIINYHLLWVAVIEYSHDIAPAGITSLVISSAGAICFSFGKVTVGLTGGQIMSAFGGRVAYRFMAMISLGFGTLIALYYYIQKKCVSKKNNFS